MSKKISIIIPAYNAENTICECLRSIAAQTFADYEVIVSNDGSSDRTAEAVEKFMDENPKLCIRLTSNPNGGVSMARKWGLELANGEWVAFVDADDTLPANALADLCTLAGDATDLVVGFLAQPAKGIPALNSPKQWQQAVVQGVIPPPRMGKALSQVGFEAFNA
ncbi:MAG: glycosyltransferase family 2 protein [Clostridium sp.]|nr:glycosyltransferase family 2 protein [Clostridium sp.]